MRLARGFRGINANARQAVLRTRAPTFIPRPLASLIPPPKPVARAKELTKDGSAGKQNTSQRRSRKAGAPESSNPAVLKPSSRGTRKQPST